MKELVIKIELESGMLIGSGNDDFELGGVDAATIKLNGKPYIPGSSLKGKMRYLLEQLNNNEISKDCINYFFGRRSDMKKENVENGNDVQKINQEYQTRLLFSDLHLVNKADNFFEIKYENSIEEDEHSNYTANPRILERTVPNLIFEGKIIVQKDQDLEKALKIIEIGKKLLEENYIGGNGSRGYGWIKKIEVDSDGK